MATNRASPALASQAEKASSNRGAAEKFTEASSRVHRESARNKDSIIPSRQRRAERR